MLKSEIKVQISFKWWLLPYLEILCFFCGLFNSEPDYKKLEKIIQKATKTRLLANGNIK